VSPIEKAEKDGTAIRMSLKDLTKLALQNNLDIAISDTNEELVQQRVLATFGPYDPYVTAGLGYQSSKRANTNLATATTQGIANTSNQAYWNFGYSQAFRTGTSFIVNWNTNRADTNQAFALFTPQYNAAFNASFTQHLLQNFKIDANRTQIKIANLNLKVNDSQFKQQVSTTIAGIQGVYWDLVGAIRQYEIARQAVELAQVTLRNNTKMVEIGTAAPISITEARASVASREGDLISAEQGILQVENTLRAKISNDRNAEIWRKVIVPTDAPEFKEYKVSLDDAIDTALKNRPELEQVDLNVKQTELNYDLYANMKKWQFDLVGGLGSTGTAGPQSYGPNGQPTINPELVGGMGTSYKNIFTGGFINWSVGFQVTIPLKNHNVESQMAQYQIQKRQYLMSRKNTEQQVQVDVRNAVQALETNNKRVIQARLARELSAEQLDGEQKRFQAGLSQNFLVLQRQNDLSNAQFSELQSLITYRKSIIALQQSMYTLLESNDFEIAKSGAEHVPALK
jgi:HAE1 family hydrophobic/amphiphilic exporter-1